MSEHSEESSLMYKHSYKLNKSNSQNTIKTSHVSFALPFERFPNKITAAIYF